MQTLNTLSTPEEKLAGLCKKYAELVSGSCKWDYFLFLNFGSVARLDFNLPFKGTSDIAGVQIHSFH